MENQPMVVIATISTGTHVPDLAEAVAGHETEVQAALSGDDAHDAAQNGEDGAGYQNGPDHAAEGEADADDAASLHARNDEHVAKGNDEHGKEGFASGRRNGSLTVFVRGGLYSNILFFFHCEGNPFRFVQLVLSALKDAGPVPVNQRLPTV